MRYLKIPIYEEVGYDDEDFGFKRTGNLETSTAYIYAEGENAFISDDTAEFLLKHFVVEEENPTDVSGVLSDTSETAVAEAFKELRATLTTIGEMAKGIRS